jgi:hypothetical protein
MITEGDFPRTAMARMVEWLLKVGKCLTPILLRYLYANSLHGVTRASILGQYMRSFRRFGVFVQNSNYLFRKSFIIKYEQKT